MGEHSRYSISHHQSGIGKNGVLINTMGISNQKDLSEAETLLLDDTYEYYFKLLEEGQLRFGINLLFDIHKHFLGMLYNWAGKTRKVEISKDNILFSPSKNIPQLLKNFEKWLNKNLPSDADSKKDISRKLAMIHNELNAIHPFREGNGRTIRLLLDLLSSQCGYETINYDKGSKEIYMEACRAGMKEEHQKMEKVIFKGLRKRKS